MVMLGFLSEALGMVSHEALVETVRENVSSRFVDLNLKAVAAGAAYAKEHSLTLS